MNTKKLSDKYKEKVLKENPGIAKEPDPIMFKQLLDILVKKEKRLDAIENEDTEFLNKLLNEAKKKYQKGLSDNIMNTKTFKYYTLMYMGNVYGYFGAKDKRTKEIDQKVEQTLKSEGYLKEEIATIFASKRYKENLEEALLYESKKDISKQIESSVANTHEFVIGNNDFKIDKSLITLQEERNREGQDTKKIIPKKILFLRERLLS